MITVGAWYLFISSLDYFWFPVLNLSAFWSQVQGGLSAAERVFALIDAESTVVQVDRQDRSPSLRGEIAFDHLQFHYLPSEPVLEDLSLHIAAGEDLALVGHTGAGKSTIAKLICRFYEFQGGELRVDGQDVRTFDRARVSPPSGHRPPGSVPVLGVGAGQHPLRPARGEGF